MPKLSDDIDVNDGKAGFLIALAKTIHKLDEISQQPEPVQAFLEELERQVQQIEKIPKMTPRAVSFLRTLVGDLQSQISLYQPRS